MKMPRIHPLLLAGLVSTGILGGVGGYTFLYAEGLSYVSDDPRACANCHVMNEHLDSWTKGSHARAAVCNACHLPHGVAEKYFAKARNGWFHSKAFTLQDFPEPIRIAPFNHDRLQRNCIECHADFVGLIAGPADVGRDEARCTVCHRSAGHMKLD
jgi:cytochrome c nitrite reductase small subunit